MQVDEKMMSRLKAGCICKGVKLSRLIDAIEEGASSIEEVNQAVGIGDGSCEGERCGEKIVELLDRKQKGTL